jgi:hypothetical protein
MLPFLSGCSDEDPARPVDTEVPPTKVLFLGSSYFAYNDLPGMFETLSQSAGRDVTVDHNYIIMGFLDDHSVSLESEALIESEQWDYVILQGAASTMGYPKAHHYIFPPYERHDVELALVTLRQKIKANYSKTEMVYCMPWAFEDGMTWLDGYDDTYFELQQRIYDNTLRFSDQIPFVTAPVGWAWNTIMTSHTEPHYLFRSDFNHPSRRGTFVMACVIYSTIFKRSTAGIPYNAGYSEDEAAYLRGVASDTVLDSLDLWNIPH